MNPPTVERDRFVIKAGLQELSPCGPLPDWRACRSASRQDDDGRVAPVGKPCQHHEKNRLAARSAFALRICRTVGPGTTPSIVPVSLWSREGGWLDPARPPGP